MSREMKRMDPQLTRLHQGRWTLSETMLKAICGIFCYNKQTLINQLKI